MLRIGLLLPNSTLYPGLSFDLTEGLRAGLARVGLANATLAVEGIGFGVDADDLLAKAQKLLLQERVDVVIGMMSRRMAERLIPLFTSANRLLLLLDVSGDFFAQEVVGPTVFYHSLQASLGSRLAGRKAVESGAKGVIQAVSFYDAGYLQSYAMAQGVETSGGQMVQYAVSSHIPAQVNLQPLQAGIDSGQAQAVTALYAGDLAAQFYQLYSQLQNPLPLWVSPMLLEEQMLDTVTAISDNVRGYVAWSESLQTPRNETFKNALRQRGRRPTLFSLLAYESADIVASYVAPVQEHGYPTPDDFTQLASLTFDSPRGQVRFDPATHYSFGPQYAANLTLSASGYPQINELTPETTVSRDEQAFRNEPAPNQHTGWHNTYLCI